MPVDDLKATAKRKAKDKVVRVAKQKVTNRGSGGGSGSGGGRRGTTGNKKVDKVKNLKKSSPILLVLLVVLVIGAAAAAWHFGFLDNLLQGDDTVPAVVAVDGNIEMHFVDVGQADAVFIITDGGTMLIDAGSNRSHSGPRLVEYLHDLGVTEITYVVATHPHEDHIGGMHLVLNEFTIGEVLMPDITHTTRTFERMITAIEDNNIPTRAPEVGSTINLGGAVFTVIHPNSDRYSNLNDWSISFRMQFGNVSMVTTGDAEARAEREMIEAGHYLNADILRLGHHGSRTSTTQEFLDAVDPSIIIIQVGADNKYGHPHTEVMDRIHAAGIDRIYRNDLHGDIILTTDGTNIDIRTDR